MPSPNRLCVATPRVNKVSETFIRDHIRSIAPGQTCVIALKAEEEAPVISEPTLSLQDRFYQPRGWVEAKWGSLRSYLRTGYTIGLDAESRRRIGPFLDEHRPAAVLAEYASTGMILADTLRSRGIPLFIHFHGWDVAIEPHQNFKRKQYQRLTAEAAGCIFPSRFLARKVDFLGLPPEKTHVVPCAVDTEAWTPAADFDPKLIVTVGRFVPKKAPLVALRAFATVSRSDAKARLEMVGDGPLLDEAKRFAASEGLSDRVVFHGPQPHPFVKDLIRRAGVFLQHSVTAEDGNIEGLPVSIMEALACGVPVVSTLHSGIPEAVRDDVNGFLVPEHDIAGTADRLLRLLGDAGLRGRLSAGAREVAVRDFDRAKQVADLRRIMGL